MTTKTLQAERVRLTFADGKWHKYTKLDIELIKIRMSQPWITKTKENWRKAGLIVFDPDRPGYFKASREQMRLEV